MEAFDALPLIGEWPLFWQTLALLLAATAVSLVGASLVEENGQTETLLDKAGIAIMLGGVTVGFVALTLFVLGVFLAAGGAVSRAMEQKVVPPSSVRIDPEWERVTIRVACPTTPDRAEVQLFGRKTDSAFRVRAYRMRAGGAGFNLTRPAWFSLSQREIYRSGPAPSFQSGPIRADGRWHSRRVEGTLSFSRGQYWLLDAGLGVRGKTGDKSLYRQSILEERCDNRIISF